MKVGDEFEVEVLSLSPTGDGVVKIDGKVLFLPLSVIGQVVRGRVIRRKKKVFFGEILEIVKKSSDEVSALDPEFPLHGGAPWQCISYKSQLKWKQQFVIDAFERIGGIANPPVEDIVPSPTTERYRNKMEFSFGFSRMRTETAEDGTKTHFDEDPGLGLHKRGNWREIVRISDTCLTTKEVIEIKNMVEEFALTSKESVWNPIQSVGFWRHLTIRQSTRTREILLNIQVAKKMPDEFWKPLIGLLQKKFSDHTKQKPHIVGITVTVFSGVSVAPPNTPISMLFGRDYFFEEFCNLQFKISTNAFFQVNTSSAEKLVDTISEFAQLNGDENVLDLFCGTGTLGLAVAGQSKSVTGIEIVESAVRDARENASRNNVENEQFLAGPVEVLLPELLAKKSFDAVIVDPPRAGLPKKARKILANIPVRKMVLVSCNPATLARDLLEIAPFGWELKKARPHDLFPHTPHVETVAVLERR